MDMIKNLDFALPSEVNMTFGEAIESLKNGYKVCRKGWNGKGMYLWTNMGAINSAYVLEEESAGDPVITEFEGINVKLFAPIGCDAVTVIPNICMWTATQNITNGWAPSQHDMFAEDWQIVP